MGLLAASGQVQSDLSDAIRLMRAGMTRYISLKALRPRRLNVMKFKSLSALLVLICSCALLTGCLGSSVASKGWSGPVASNGSLYVGSMSGKVIAFDDIGADSEHPVEQWRYPDETVISYIYSDPVVDNGNVYIGCYNGKVYVLNASRGYREWIYPSDKYLGAIVGSPAVVDGTLYFGSSDKKLYAINTETRVQAWPPFETGGKIWSTPVVYNGTVYVGSFDHKLYAIDAESGIKLWEFSAGGAIVSTPIIYNDAVYFGSMDQKFYAVDVTTGALKGGFTPFKADDWFWGKAIAYNGSIIAASLAGTIYALDAESGNKLWEAGTEGTIRGNPALVNNRVIVGTDEGSNMGRVYCFAADTGERLWLYPSENADPMYAIHASIGSSGNVVYVHTTNQKIYAFDVEQMGAEARYLWTTSTGGGE
jgi:outer membrane protein assembly factor BamB